MYDKKYRKVIPRFHQNKKKIQKYIVERRKNFLY